jgi:hypothetical protein
MVITSPPMRHNTIINVRGLYFVAASPVIHRQPPVLSQKQLFQKNIIPVVVVVDPDDSF